jgi:hypothetical protein
MFPATTERVSANTTDEVNRHIRQQTKARIEAIAAEGPLAIDRRLRALDEEWDVERYLETMAPSFTLLGIGLGLTRNRAWFLLPLVVQTFFLQHALQGWCPPLPVLRHLGVRTCHEIEQERYALKALRGDFVHVAGSVTENEAVGAAEAMHAVES